MIKIFNENSKIKLFLCVKSDYNSDVKKSQLQYINLGKMNEIIDSEYDDNNN